MPEYIPAKPAVLTFVREVAEKYHGDLMEHGVTFSVTFVHPNERDDSGEPVLKHHGYPAAATVKPTSYKQRAKGAPDLEIEIDWLWWKDEPEDERVATIDHELEHAELVRDKDGQVKLDKACRPKIKTRLHDVVIGGFRSVMRRHGKAALEFQQLRDLCLEYRQQVFAWTDDSAPQDEPEDLDLKSA